MVSAILQGDVEISQAEGAAPRPVYKARDRAADRGTAVVIRESECVPMQLAIARSSHAYLATNRTYGENGRKAASARVPTQCAQRLGRRVETRWGRVFTLSGCLNAQRSTQLYDAFRPPSGNQTMSPVSKSPARTVWKGRSQWRVCFAV